MTLTYDSQTINDIFEWDINNWSKALNLWESYLQNSPGKVALTVGEKNGGLTLWLGLNNILVYSTDVEGVTEQAKETHSKYQISGNVVYDKANFLDLHYADNTFDIVAFKSVLGGLRTEESQQLALDEAFRVLKPGGMLFFAENLQATFFHMMMRKFFIKWGGYWRYLKFNDLNRLLYKFSSVRYNTYGFWGTFGRNENQRQILSSFDDIFCNFVPEKHRYIIFGVCIK